MMWRRSTASGSVQETSRGVDAFVREPGGELAQRSSSGARLMGSVVPPPVESLTVVRVDCDRPRRTADGDRKRSIVASSIKSALAALVPIEREAGAVAVEPPRRRRDRVGREALGVADADDDVACV